MNRSDPEPVRSLSRETIAEHAPRLVRFFRSLGADAWTADDLTQEVFVRCMRTNAVYEERGALASYLLRIGYRLWIDEKRARRPVLPEEPGSAGWADRESVEELPLEALLRAESGEILRATLAELPAEQRALLELGMGQGVRYREISKILGIPVGTVKSRVFAAACRLRAALVRRMT
ncbi:MAG: RNA polymerase sigma factor [Planctomycetes bacterium]|nr:RNA polymerase sigma factor [Planctomycetota bacterium]